MLLEISEKVEELESHGKQYLICNSKTSRPSIASENYGDILYKKGVFFEKLMQTGKNVVDNSLDTPMLKYTLHSYKQLSLLLESRCKDSKQDNYQRAELLKTQKHETCQHISLKDKLANIAEEEDKNLIIQARLQFEKVNPDLVKVISITYPNEGERKKFLIIVAQLVEARINNLDNRSLDDQYVQVLPISLNNPGLRCLIDGVVVVEHPQDPLKFRFKSADD